LCCYFNNSNANTIDPIQLLADTSLSGADFGFAVSANQNRVAIGAPRVNSRGVVYIYQRQGTSWSQTAIIAYPNSQPLTYFGSSVSLDGDRILIGAQYESISAVEVGGAYVFDLIDGNWIESAHLTASNAEPTDNLGNSVSLENDIAVIGAGRRSANSTTRSGAAYVYEFDGTDWLEVTELNASIIEVNATFGSSVSVNNNRILVGGEGFNRGVGNAGLAFIFEKISDTWTETAILTGGLIGNVFFGNSVSLYQDKAIIGANFDSQAALFAGAAYMFEYDIDNDEWIQTNKFIANDAAAEDRFGASVSLYEKTLLIGADLDDDNGSSSGSVYEYTLTNGSWQFTQKLLPASVTANYQFGAFVSVFGGNRLIGAPFNIVPNTTVVGTAFIYTDVLFFDGFE
jgi:hypothetical protein